MQLEREKSNDAEAESSNEEEMSSDKHPLTLEDAIINWQVVAAIDASMDGTLMTTHWIVAPFEHQIKIEGGIESTKWEKGMMSAGKWSGLLALANDIANKTKHLNAG